MSVPVIFLSAVKTPYEPRRGRLAERLRRAGFNVMHQGDFTERGVPTMAKINEYLGKCDVIVHLVGPEFGSPAPKPTMDGVLGPIGREWLNRHGMQPLRESLADQSVRDGVSYTQWEA